MQRGPLKGSECTNCGTKHFPIRVVCPEPECGNGKPENIFTQAQSELVTDSVVIYEAQD
jgi:uncharacterized OB-fold protein